MAVLTALGVGAFFGSLYGPDRKHYVTVAGDKAGQNDYQGPSQSLSDIAGLPGFVERAIANRRPKTGTDHEKRDLAAQEASALWAFWIVVASFLSMLITTIGTILLYQQIKLTREAVKDTGEATKAMREANQIATEASARQLRPYLHITSASFEIRMSMQQSIDSMHNPNIIPDIALFTVFFKNHGQTTALAVELWIKCSIEMDRAQSKEFVPDSETVWGNMPPNMEHNQKVAFEKTGHYYDSIVEGTHMVLLDGRLEYKDFFGNSYRTDFRYYSTKTHFTSNTYQIAWHGNEAT